MHMPLTLFICGCSRAADPTSSLARRLPIIEDLRNARWEAGPKHPGAVGQTVLPSDSSRESVFRCVHSEIEV
jgi:hypothetical protein